MEMESSDVYPRTGRGLVVIINNINFSSMNYELRARSGSEIDDENLKKLFGDVIQGPYDVQSHRDCTLERTTEIIQSVQNTLKEKSYCQLLWFISSHGVEGGIYTSDGMVIQLTTIIDAFNRHKLIEMDGLPKVFVFQADNLGPMYVPPDAHFVAAQASTPGLYSFRSMQTGSLFVSALCDVVAEYYKTAHLTEMLATITQRVKAWPIKKNRVERFTQIPTYSSNVTKRMYLLSAASSSAADTFASRPDDPICRSNEDSLGLQETASQMALDPDTYSTTKRGLVLVINNMTFEVPEKFRKGSEIDEQNIRDLFENKLKDRYDVEVRKNCKLQDMHDSFTKCQKALAADQYDQFFCFVLSHGNEDGVETCDGDDTFMKPNDIIKHFKAQEVKKMARHPKVFIFQVCRGKRFHEFVDTDGGQGSAQHSWPNSGKDGITLRVPDEANILAAFATTEGHCALRIPSGGTVFISSICDIFSKFYKEDHLTDLLLKVNRDVSSKKLEHRTEGECVQMPKFETTFTKKLLLHHKE